MYTSEVILDQQNKNLRRNPDKNAGAHNSTDEPQSFRRSKTVMRPAAGHDQTGTPIASISFAILAIAMA